MHEELIDLVANMERGRKQWKTTGINSEKKVHDSLLLLEKANFSQDWISTSRVANINLYRPKLGTIKLPIEQSLQINGHKTL